MKKYLFIAFVFLYTFSNAQTQGKKIIITQAPKTVPAGKVWKLERGKPTIVQLNEGTLKSGTLCNALFLSRPGLVFNINKGDYYKAIGYGIIFKEFEKVQYTNDLTYTITPISFVDKDFDFQELSNDSPENIGTKEIEFKAGETVFVGSCFITVELTEYNMSAADLEIEKKKLAALEKEKNRLKSNFKIPINPEKYVEPGTKPELKDSSLNLIVFSSDGVLHKRPGKGFAFDDVSVWTMALNIEEFSLKSSNGINKTYKVLDIKYDDALRMQEFQLGDFEGKQTHTLHISWSNSSKQYSVLLTAVDRSEEYQFQNTEATKKQ
jgi:hypothetical protein